MNKGLLKTEDVSGSWQSTHGTCEFHIIDFHIIDFFLAFVRYRPFAIMTCSLCGGVFPGLLSTVGGEVTCARCLRLKDLSDTDRAAVLVSNMGIYY
jgi:hypothetical protein